MTSTTINTTSTIGVTAATGTIGSIVVRLLQARGLDVRPLGRDAASGVGLEGVDVLFLACGNVPEQVAFECAVIDAAQRSGVGRIVKLSARGAGIGSAIAYWHWHGLIEQHLQASGIPATVLQPGFAMTNLLGAAEHVRQQGHTVHGPVYLDWMKALSYYFYDPDGNLLEFWSPDPRGDDK